MRIQFEKKGNTCTVEVSDAKVTIEVGGEKVEASPQYNAFHKSWVYNVVKCHNKRFFELLGVKPQPLKIGHESAEVAEKELRLQKEEKIEKEKEAHFTACSIAKMVLVKKYREWDGYRSFDGLVVSHVIPIEDETKGRLKSGAADWYRELIDSMVWQPAGDYRYSGLTDIDASKSSTAMSLCEEVEGELMLGRDEVIAVSDEQLQIILSELEQEKAKQDAEEKAAFDERKRQLDEKFEEAKRTGERVLMRSWHDRCNNPREECSLDIVSEWAMPDGTTKVTRQHTW
ncbi:hypothetical protein J6TS7_20940 [Paenibacillus dendritiformis]|uniref:hypothetical protein n=1 Tax=Paenibacillus TaxID=44249 RepID=UPI001B27F364|nr:hypothetical protein [Paenibacillus dendritiformis]GIO78484.1 hypothetical protein J6TS7_20940 [Paenibacillus dendritiformis]